MNRYFFGVVLAVICALILGVQFGLLYSQAVLLFGLVAAISAPFVIHKIPGKNQSLVLLFLLAIFASYPFKKLFQIDGFFGEFLVSLGYIVLLYIIGFGWRRSWT
ncbi:MAG: hypothetical protein ABJO27_26210 [Pseudoruegeria sp.]